MLFLIYQNVIHKFRKYEIYFNPIRKNRAARNYES